MRCLVFALFLGASSAAAQTPYQLQRELRVGTLDGETAITDPTHAFLLQDGGLLAAFAQEHVVRQFSPTGEIVRTFGRAGEGPGEFRGLVYVGATSDGIYAVDARLRRVTYFDASGAVVREVSWDDRMLAPARPIVGGFSAFDASINGEVAVDPDRPWPVRRYTAEGRLLDTLATINVSSREFMVRGRRVRSPLADGDLAGYSPAGDIVVTVERRIPVDGPRGTFTVKWISVADRSVIGRKTYAFTGRELSSDAIAQLTAGFAASGAPPEQVQELRAALRGQKYMPPVSRIVVVDDAVWLAREALGQTRVRWYRFTPADGATGYIDLPVQSRVLAGTGNSVWIAERDALDVPLISRYRLLSR